MIRPAIFMAVMAGQAQAACFERAQIIARLQAEYGEQRSGGGVQNAQSVIEVLVSPESGTWTILRTGANGMACILVSGTNWRDFEPEPVGEDG